MRFGAISDGRPPGQHSLSLHYFLHYRVQRQVLIVKESFSMNASIIHQ